MIFYRIVTLLAVISVEVEALRRLKHRTITPRVTESSAARSDFSSPNKCPDMWGLVPCINERFVYSVQVTLGEQDLRLLLDTGSGDMWVNDIDSKVGGKPANDCFESDMRIYKDRTPRLSSHQCQSENWIEPFDNLYADQTEVSGGRVSIPLTVFNSYATEGHTFRSPNQRLGIANRSEQCIGILGVGYSKHEDSSDNNFISNLHSSGSIASKAYSLFPTDDDVGGSVLFGAVDGARFEGSLTTLSLHSPTGRQTQPTVNMTAITTHKGSQASGTFDDFSADISVVLDTGSVLTYLPKRDVANLIEKFKQDMPRATSYPPQDDIHQVDCDWKENSRRYVNFTFTAVTIQVPASELILRVPMEKGDVCVFGIASTEHSHGQAVLGYTFLRSVYAVFDLSNDKVHLARYDRNWSSRDHVEDRTVKDIREDMVPFTDSQITDMTANSASHLSPADKRNSVSVSPAYGGRTSSETGSAATVGPSCDVSTSLPAPVPSLLGAEDAATLVNRRSALLLWTSLWVLVSLIWL